MLTNINSSNAGKRATVGPRELKMSKTYFLQNTNIER